MVEVLNILLRGKGLFIPVYFCGLRQMSLQRRETRLDGTLNFKNKTKHLKRTNCSYWMLLTLLRLLLPLFCIKLAVASVDANKIVHSLAYAVSFLATYVIA